MALLKNERSMFIIAIGDKAMFHSDGYLVLFKSENKANQFMLKEFPECDDFKTEKVCLHKIKKGGSDGKKSRC